MFQLKKNLNLFRAVLLGWTDALLKDKFSTK
jgi:hypothetical protein